MTTQQFNLTVAAEIRAKIRAAEEAYRQALKAADENQLTENTLDCGSQERQPYTDGEIRSECAALELRSPVTVHNFADEKPN
jgi:hypothetical protein